MTMPAAGLPEDPFTDPITPPSTFPNQSALRGRLILITPRKIETRPSNLNPGQMQETITADVQVVDGRGAIPQFKNNQPTGQWLEGPNFTGVWLSGQRVIEQLRPFVGTGRSVLGTLETMRPGEVPIKGNPWGLNAATEEQKAQARAVLANQAIGGAAAPAAAPAQAQPQYAPQPQYAQAPQPQYAQAPQPQYAQAPAPAAPPVQGNPFGGAPATSPAQAPQTNPFGTQAAPPAQGPVNPFAQPSA